MIYGTGESDQPAQGFLLISWKNLSPALSFFLSPCSFLCSVCAKPMVRSEPKCTIRHRWADRAVETVGEGPVLFRGARWAETGSCAVCQCRTHVKSHMLAGKLILIKWVSCKGNVISSFEWTRVKVTLEKQPTSTVVIMCRPRSKPSCAWTHTILPIILWGGSGVPQEPSQRVPRAFSSPPLWAQWCGSIQAQTPSDGTVPGSPVYQLPHTFL